MAIARALFQSSDLYFAELRCAPNDPEWSEGNLVTRPIIAFPATPVWQAHDGAQPTLINANHAVFHHAGSEYRRERFRGRGYRCVFFFPAHSLIREIAAEVDPAAADSGTYRFPVRTAPLEAAAFTLSRRLAGELASGRASNLRAREGLYEVIRSAVHSGYRHLAHRRGVRPSTARAHSEIVEETKELITRPIVFGSMTSRASSTSPPITSLGSFGPRPDTPSTPTRPTFGCARGSTGWSEDRRERSASWASTWVSAATATSRRPFTRRWGSGPPRWSAAR